LGVSEDKWVYLRGYGDADDALITKRESLTKAPAVKIAAQTALKMADCGIENIDRFDIYSCFPCAVIFASEAMGIDWQNEQQELTLTGGLPFFGGPGNNYSLHAIAEMVDCLREDRQQLGLIFANGGYLSKASVGIYSAEAPSQWQPSDLGTQLTATAHAYAQEGAKEIALNEATIAEIESYTVSYKRGEPVFANLLAKAADGQRLAARLPADQNEFMLALDSADLIGSAVTVYPAEKGNYCAPA
jgi:acetyl-CoA C-acetyltransferase